MLNLNDFILYDNIKSFENALNSIFRGIANVSIKMDPAPLKGSPPVKSGVGKNSEEI